VTTSNGSSSAITVEETGTVKWFNVEKGFGVIARDSGGKDVFVHISALERSGLTALNEGDESTSMSLRAGRGWKRQGFAWSRFGEPRRRNTDGCCPNPKNLALAALSIRGDTPFGARAASQANSSLTAPIAR
jgi:CspA family cold shock protein